MTTQITTIPENALLLQKIEEKTIELLRRRAMHKEEKERLDCMQDEIRAMYEDLELTQPLFIPIDEDNKAIIKQVRKTRNVVNKEGLLNAIGVDKEEMKTVWDIAKLTEKKVLTTEMIKTFSDDVTTVRTNISKKKLTKKEKNKKN